MTCREARAILARSAYRVLYAHMSEMNLEKDEQGATRPLAEQALIRQAFMDFLEKLRSRGET